MRRIVGQNVTLLETAGQQAEGARGFAAEVLREGAIAARPLLILLDEPPLGIREQPWAAVRVRNVGNGSALNFIVWMHTAGHLYRSAGAEARGFSGPIHLAPGDTFEPGPSRNMLPVGRAHGYLDPGAAVVADDPGANLVAYCGDLSGTVTASTCAAPILRTSGSEVRTHRPGPEHGSPALVRRVAAG